MFSATVTLAAGGQSLRTLVNAAVPNEIPGIDQFTGRSYQVTLIAQTGATASIVSRSGGPIANNGVLIPVNIEIVFRSPTGNQISIDEIFLAGAGTVGVLILVL